MGFSINDVHLSDFGQCMASRDTGSPTKNLVTKTVPYMSGFYDFSKLYGAAAYESREVTYVIQMIGSPCEVQEQKSEVMEWLSQVHDADIYDDDIQDRHFHGSLSSMEWEESEDGESGSLTVVFLCHPFMIADSEKTKSLAVGSNTVTIEGQPVRFTAVPSGGAATITVNGRQQSVSKEAVVNLRLMPGENTVQVSTNPVTVRWREETM